MNAGSAIGFCMFNFLFSLCTNAAPFVLSLLSNKIMLLVCNCTFSSSLSLITVVGELIL